MWSTGGKTRLGEAEGESNLLFYVDDIHIAGRELDWVQDILLVKVDIFGRVGLKTNLEKKMSWSVHRTSYGDR